MSTNLIITSRSGLMIHEPDSRLSLFGEVAITEVRFEGIGTEGFPLSFIAARA